MTDTPTLCPHCGATPPHHGTVHVRHGNGGGHNEPCPRSKAAQADTAAAQTVDELFSPGHNPADMAAITLRGVAIVDLEARILREWPAYIAAHGIEVPDPPRPHGMTAKFARHAATVAVDAMIGATADLFESRTAAEAQTAALLAASGTDTEDTA